MIDQLDARLIELLTAEPRVGMLEASRRLRVARGTVQARLDRLQAGGVITGYGPEISPAALGHGVMAFVTLEIRQAGGHDPVASRLAAIAEVLEAHTITGAGDMLCRVVARTNADLQRVIDAIVDVPGVLRTSTVIALDTPVPYRALPLVRAAAGLDRGLGRRDRVPGQLDAGLDDRRDQLVLVRHLVLEGHPGHADAAEHDRRAQPLGQARVRLGQQARQGPQPLLEQLGAASLAAGHALRGGLVLVQHLEDLVPLGHDGHVPAHDLGPGLRGPWLAGGPGDEVVELADVVLHQAGDDVFLGLEVV